MRRGFFTAMVAALLLAGPLGAENGGSPAAAYSVAELQAAGFAAVRAGDFDLAVRIGDAILARDPEDAFGHYLVAQAALRGGDAETAAVAARQSWRFADGDVQKHEAARIAAQAAAAQGRYFPAQLWMRRALQTAPDDRMVARAATEFRAARREARLSVEGGLSIAPSSNVNGGASSEDFTIDGVPLPDGWSLSPSAQALSGTEIEARLKLGYRLHRSERSETQLRFSGKIRRVRLSEDARDKAPTLENSDLSSDSLEFGLNHRHKLGETAMSPSVTGGVYWGRSWYAGDPSYDYGRAHLALIQPLGERTALTVGLSAQEQRGAVSAAQDVTSRGWHLGVMHSFENRSRVSMVWQVSRSDSDNSKLEVDSKGLRLGYALGKPIGPVKLEAGLSAYRSDYPDYKLGLIAIPGGREDTLYAADVNLVLHEMDYMGFVPKVTFKAERSESNVSRFDTEEFSIRLGFESRF